MTIGWADLAFRLDGDAAQAAADEWGWLIAEPWTPLLRSMFGGISLERGSGGVFWLECGTGEIERVADSPAAFDAFVGGPRDAEWQEKVDWWFLPPLVEALHDAGKRPAPGHCYARRPCLSSRAASSPWRISSSPRRRNGWAIPARSTASSRERPTRRQHAWW